MYINADIGVPFEPTCIPTSTTMLFDIIPGICELLKYLFRSKELKIYTFTDSTCSELHVPDKV